MIRPPRVNAASVFALATKQIAAVKARPDLEKALLVPLSTIETHLTDERVRLAAYEDMLKAGKAMKADSRATMFEFSELLKANIELAGEAFGPSSAEREKLGGKPRRVENPNKKKATVASTTDLPPST